MRLFRRTRRRKPGAWTPKPKYYRIKRKNAKRNKGYKKFWPNL